MMMFNPRLYGRSLASALNQLAKFYRQKLEEGRSDFAPVAALPEEPSLFAADMLLMLSLYLWTDDIIAASRQDRAFAEAIGIIAAVSHKKNVSIIQIIARLDALRAELRGIIHTHPL